MAYDAVEETEDVVFKNLPLRNIFLIFIVTFSLVFVIFTMVEPNFQCTDGDFSNCTFRDVTGNFVLGVAIAGILFLINMVLLYMTLSEYFMT